MVWLASSSEMLLLGLALPLHVIEAEDPVGELGPFASRCRSNTGAYRRMHPERPASGPGQRGPPYPWPFRRAGGCAPLSGMGGGSPPGWSTARTEVKALLTSRESRSSRLRMPERMPAIKRILNCCWCGLPFRARQHLLRGDEDGQMVSGSWETAGRSSISVIRVGGLRGYYRQEAKVYLGYVPSNRCFTIQSL